jgi:hypothetical protein
VVGNVESIKDKVVDLVSGHDTSKKKFEVSAYERISHTGALMN